MPFDLIPPDIKAYSQWINWKYEYIVNDKGERKLTKIPVRPLDQRNASVTNPRDWTDFFTAVGATALRTYELDGISHSYGLGFVFTKSDPFTGIDLDNPEGNVETFQRQKVIFETLNSYTERSPSGLGLHIIVNAVLPGNGRRRNKIECYDALRFFTFTGDVYHNVPVANRTLETCALWQELGADIQEIAHTGYEAETYSDGEVCEKAASAFNGEKFKRLWSGDWQTDYSHQSQSEADFALINIIGFYSRNLTQTVRIFRLSGLANRQKAKRGNYVTQMAKRSFDRMTPNVTTKLVEGEIWFDATTVEPWAPKLPLPEYVPQPYLGPALSAPVAQAVRYAPPMPVHLTYSEEDPGRPLDFDPPKPPPVIPGLVGMLIDQAWQATAFQVAEVAVASALSTMSVLCSRAYRHGTLGLSLYLLVLAQTSTGKSFGYTANDKWQNALVKHYQSFKPPNHAQGKLRAETLEKMIMGEIGSAQGLAQQMPLSPATLFHADEYVASIKEMARPNPSPHVAAIKSELLRLMEMSGPGRVYRGRKYSLRSSTSVESANVIMASLTILATGTPGAFYNDMSEDLLTSGFLPRFTILEYEGGLTARNENVRKELDPAMMEALIRQYDRSWQVCDVLSSDENAVIDVQPKDDEAADKLVWFDNLCMREVQQANKRDEPTAGMWSRAKEHVRQIASLIAIGCNPYSPKIEREHVNIAIAIVMPTLTKIARKVANSETGTGDDRLEAEIRRLVVSMIKDGWGKFRTYGGINRTLLETGFYQLAVIKNYCTKLSVFKNHRLGANTAFDNVINSMAKYGVLKLTDANGVKCCQANLEHFQR